MKATRNKLILRYRKDDLEALKRVGSLYFIDTLNKAEHVCTTAIVEDSGSDEFKKGDVAALSYRLSWDENLEDRGNTKVNPYYIQTEENGDILRWCWAVNNIRMGGMDIVGVKRKGKLIPKKGVVFAELPPPIPEKFGRLFIPNSFREQKTDRGGYHTKVKHIHPEDAAQLNLKVGDEIYCEKDSDIKKVIFGEEILTIPAHKVLGKC